MTHRPPTPVEPALPGTAGRRQTSASGSPGDGEGAGVRAVADCSPSACGRVWLKYVIAAAVPRIARIAAPATTFHISPKDTHPIRRQGRGVPVRERRGGPPVRGAPPPPGASGAARGPRPD